MYRSSSPGLCFIKYRRLYIGLLAYVKTSLKFYETEAWSIICPRHLSGHFFPSAWSVTDPDKAYVTGHLWQGLQGFVPTGQRLQPYNAYLLFFYRQVRQAGIGKPSWSCWLLRHVGKVLWQENTAEILSPVKWWIVAGSPARFTSRPWWQETARCGDVIHQGTVKPWWQEDLGPVGQVARQGVGWGWEGFARYYSQATWIETWGWFLKNSSWS